MDNVFIDDEGPRAWSELFYKSRANSCRKSSLYTPRDEDTTQKEEETPGILPRKDVDCNSLFSIETRDTIIYSCHYSSNLYSDFQTYNERSFIGSTHQATNFCICTIGHLLLFATANSIFSLYVNMRQRGMIGFMKVLQINLLIASYLCYRLNTFILCLWDLMWQALHGEASKLIWMRYVYTC